MRINFNTKTGDMRGMLYVLFLILISLSDEANAQHFYSDDSVLVCESLTETEIDQRTNHQFDVINLGKRGLLLVDEDRSGLFNQKNILRFTRFNAVFDSLWTQEFHMERSSEIIRSWLDTDRYLLFIEDGKDKYRILSISLETGVFRVSDFIPMLKRADYRHFCALDSTVYLGGEHQGKPFVLKLSPSDGTPKILTASAVDNSVVTLVQPDTVHKTLLVVLAPRLSSEDKIFVNLYDKKGEPISKTQFPTNDEYRLLSFRAIQPSREEITLIGTYALKKWSEPQGFFSLKIDKGKQEQFRFYDFAYMKNYFNFLKESRRERVKQKIKDKLRNDKHTRYDHDIMLDGLREENGYLVLTGQGFTPNFVETPDQAFMNDRLRFSRFRMYRFGFDPFFGRPWMPGPVQNQRYIGSYTYSHGIVCIFDKDGKLIRDNVISMDETVQNQPLSIFSGISTGDHIGMCYYNEKKLHYTTSKGNAAAPEILKFEPEKLPGNRKITERYQISISPLYGNKFILSGYLTIKDEEKNRRIKSFVLMPFRFDFDKKADE